jgi:hypothetical protein
MKAMQYEIAHHLQPTNSTCGETAMAMLLSYYGINVDPLQLLEEMPQIEDEHGEPLGSVPPQSVAWAQKRGLACTMYAFDCLILDLAWQGYSTAKLIERLRAVRDTRNAPAMGAHITKEYIDAYIEMLESGAKLKIQPLVAPDLLWDLLKQGPFFTIICSTVSRGVGRTRNTGLRKSAPDDVNGQVFNHGIVIYGNDADGNFLIADPWEGEITMSPMKLALCIMAAQVECDNMIVTMKR